MGVMRTSRPRDSDIRERYHQGLCLEHRWTKKYIAEHRGPRTLKDHPTTTWSAMARDHSHRRPIRPTTRPQRRPQHHSMKTAREVNARRAPPSLRSWSGCTVAVHPRGV